MEWIQMFIDCETSNFIIEMNKMSLDKEQPIFRGGLSLRTELDNYIGTLEKRFNVVNKKENRENREIIQQTNKYIKHGTLCKNFYFKHFPEILPTKQLSDEYLDTIISDPMSYIDDFGNNGLIALIDIKHDKLTYQVYSDLISKHTDLINIPGKFGDFAIDHAIIHQRFDLVKLLLPYTNPVLKNAFNGNSLIWLICSFANKPIPVNESQEIISSLVDHGFPSHDPDIFSLSAYDYSLFYDFKFF